MLPKGGTEIQLEYLHKHVKKELLDKINLTTSIPEKEPVVIDKTNVLWVHNSYDQPNLAPWFKNKLNHGKYDWYVYNSHWTYEKYRYFFDVPTDRALVIANGFDDDLVTKKTFEPHPKIKMVYTSTPWRGLDVLLAAMEAIQKNEHVELDVYSSCEVYGKSFAEANDKHYQALYDQAKQLPNVNYIGYKPNEYIKENLKNYDLYAYPSIWEETFCISALEAMAAGLYCIVTNYGALYETCAEFPMTIPYSNNYRSLSNKFAAGIDMAADAIKTPGIQEHLKEQIKYVNRFYDWRIKGISWTRFLQGALNAK